METCAVNEIKALIADDRQVVRSGLRAMLVNTEIEIVSEASSGNEAVDAVRNNAIDIVLLDIRMPDGDGLTALTQIRDEHPELPCLMLSTYDNPVYVKRSRMLGAAGYVVKGTSREHIVQAIRLVASGQTFWSDGNT